MNLHDYDLIQLGKREGREEGMQLGLSQGRHDTQLETARNFLAMGFDLQQIAQGTGLSVDELQTLKKSLDTTAAGADAEAH